jgi:hypothetical protein
MTTTLKIVVGHNGGPFGQVLIGTVCDGTVNARLYSPARLPTVCVHGTVIAMAREANEQDVADREG